MEVFAALHEAGKTVVLITHEAEVAAHARRVVHVRDGRILAADTEPSPAGEAS